MDVSYNKSYIGLLSSVGAAVSVITGCTPSGPSLYKKLREAQQGSMVLSRAMRLCVFERSTVATRTADVATTQIPEIRVPTEKQSLETSPRTSISSN